MFWEVYPYLPNRCTIQETVCWLWSYFQLNLTPRYLPVSFNSYTFHCSYFGLGKEIRQMYCDHFAQPKNNSNDVQIHHTFPTRPRSYMKILPILRKITQSVNNVRVHRILLNLHLLFSRKSSIRHMCIDFRLSILISHPYYERKHIGSPSVLHNSLFQPFPGPVFEKKRKFALTLHHWQFLNVTFEFSWRSTLRYEVHLSCSKLRQLKIAIHYAVHIFAENF